MKSLPRVKPISLARHGIDHVYLTLNPHVVLSENLPSWNATVLQRSGALLVSAGVINCEKRALITKGQTEIYLGRYAAATLYIGVSLDDASRSHLDSALEAS